MDCTLGGAILSGFDSNRHKYHRTIDVLKQYYNTFVWEKETREYFDIKHLIL